MELSFRHRPYVLASICPRACRLILRGCRDNKLASPSLQASALVSKIWVLRSQSLILALPTSLQRRRDELKQQHQSSSSWAAARGQQSSAGSQAASASAATAPAAGSPGHGAAASARVAPLWVDTNTSDGESKLRGTEASGSAAASGAAASAGAGASGDEFLTLGDVQRSIEADLRVLRVFVEFLNEHVRANAAKAAAAVAAKAEAKQA